MTAITEEWKLYYDEDDTRVFEHHIRFSDGAHTFIRYNEEGDTILRRTLSADGSADSATWEYEKHRLFRIVTIASDGGVRVRYYEETAGLAPDGFFGGFLAMYGCGDTVFRRNPLLLGHVSEE